MPFQKYASAHQCPLGGDSAPTEWAVEGCVRAGWWAGHWPPLHSARHPAGVNIGGAGSYIYEKPSAEGPQVTGPIEVPVAWAEERKASGPPKGPSKGGPGLVSGGWLSGQLHPTLTPPSPQPPVSPLSLGSPTCVLAATRGSTLVSASPQAPESLPWRARASPSPPLPSREGDVSGQGLAPAMPAL